MQRVESWSYGVRRFVARRDGVLDGGIGHGHTRHGSANFRFSLITCSFGHREDMVLHIVSAFHCLPIQTFIISDFLINVLP